ncbi:extracellular solute-binding protein [Litoreibacter albidus]|uniref:Multiple sugar transport system substrate-binding protein n=1 Tax=Litoreibacter albidus TaxID=670155 RepID=A0A1H3CKT7_9RHOB|nr:extracellular solute-binding protein [Litoreibacter albidus]SDX54862.1 multiple sugar transport system substrate-binding protein [Litoreibacter albidus]
MRNLLLATALVPIASLANAACAPDFTGVTLTVSTQNGPFIASALKTAADSWSEKTCGTVDIVEFPFSELYPKFLTAMSQQTGDFDVIGFIPAWVPDFAPFLSAMPAAMQEGPAWEDIHPVYRERLMSWGGEVKSATMDGDMHMLNYRADLFEDADNMAAFKEKYGYDLAAPVTWDQYYDIAEFFTASEAVDYGTAEAYRRGGQQFWYFFSHAASYTNNPNTPGAMFFDPETMDAQINNPGWLKALEDYKRGLDFNPPGALNNGSGDVRPLYSGGSVAMNIDWADSGVLGATEGAIAGNVRTAILPGSDKIWNSVTDSWDTFEAPVASPFLAFGGWQLAVPTDSENKDAAWSFVQEVTSAEVSGQAIVTANTGVNPYRLSHYENLDNWSAIFTPEEAESYLAAQRGSLDSPNVALDLRLPGFFSYTEVLEIELSKAIAGQVEPQEALDAIAAEWNKLTDEFGRENQLAAYRSSMGLE